MSDITIMSYLNKTHFYTYVYISDPNTECISHQVIKYIWFSQNFQIPRNIFPLYLISLTNSSVFFHRILIIMVFRRPNRNVYAVMQSPVPGNEGYIFMRNFEYACKFSYIKIKK